MVAALGFVALASTPARADLIISCSGQSGCGTLASTTTNDRLDYANHTFGNFSIGPLTILGVLLDAGGLMDVTNLDVSSSGGGSISLFFTETNLSAGAAAEFIMSFTGNLSGDMTDTRSFYLDPTNGGGQSILLGSCSGGTCAIQTSLLQNLQGLFSITEEIDLTARGAGKLSSDDDILLPEPAALSLFGVALLALGFLWRRRKLHDRA